MHKRPMSLDGTTILCLFTPHLHRCHAEVFPHVFAEEGGVGESKQLTDLLDGEVGLLQVEAYVFQDVLANPFIGSLARMLLAKSREVFGRDAEFVGIPFYWAMLHIDRVQQVEEPLKMVVGGMGTKLLTIGKNPVFDGTAESEDGCAQKRLNDIGTEGIVDVLVEAQAEHLVEIGIELQVDIFHGDDVQSAYVDHIIPNVYFLAQETLKDMVGEEHRLEVEVRTDHQVGDNYILRNDGHLVLVQFYHLPIQRPLSLSLGADGDGVHRHMGGANLSKLLNAVDDDNVVIGIAYLYVFIASKRL